MTAETVALPAADQTVAIGGKFLTFCLDEEDYGIEILRVREIVGVMAITPVPKSPQSIRGVINLRGKVIPILDLRFRFGMPAIENTEETCIIVVQTGDVFMGVVVDKVSEVLDIATEDIVDTPAFGHDVDTDFFQGIGKSEGRVKLLLDIDEVLTGEGIDRALASA